MTIELMTMTVPALLMKDQPRSQVPRSTLVSEGSRVAGKHLRFLEHDTGDDDRTDADEVGAGRDKTAAREERARDEADDGHLGTAGNESGGHDRHAAVTLVLDGT